MKHTQLPTLMMAGLVCSATFLNSSGGASAQQQSMPPLVSQMYSGQWPDQATVVQLNKDWFYQNAVAAYVRTLPVLNMIGPANMMYPTDFSYWEKLKAFVDYEPVGAIPADVRGLLASIGIVKGAPFAPDASAKDALSRAVETAPRLIFARRITGRADGRDRYSDRQWLNAWAGADADWFQPNYLDVDLRATYFQTAPAMVMDTINDGSKYPFTLKDKDGNLLDGSNSYKLHLPAHIPAALYWAVTIYNPQDGTMPATDQPFPSRDQFDKVVVNADGSVDLYFSPTKHDGVDEKNWIQTLKDRAFIVALRLYGAETAFYDQTWKPDDVMKLK